MSKKLIDLIQSNKTSAALAELDNEEIQRNINDVFECDSRYSPATCLYIACKKGNEPVVIKILGIKGVDVNKGDSKSITPLHAATLYHQTSVTELLLQVNEILCKGDDEGHTPIHWAAIKGYDDILTLLLDKFPSEINCQNNNQNTPLHRSVYNGHPSTTSVLLQRGAQCLGNHKGDNPIHTGAMGGYDVIVKQLLEYFPDKINVQNNTGKTPLYLSLLWGSTKVSKVLRESGASEVLSASLPSVEQAMVLYPHKAEHALQLDLKTGDSIDILHQDTGYRGKWLGRVHGKTGLVPSDCVEVIHVKIFLDQSTSAKTHPAPLEPERTEHIVQQDDFVEALVEYEYVAKQDDELSMKPGDIITEIRRMDGGWWEGNLGEKKGVFPDNFVKVLDKIPKDVGQKKPPAVGHIPLLTKTTSQLNVRPVQQDDFVEALVEYEYVAEQDDELSMKPGDIITEIRRMDGGWWEGNLGEKKGVFPDNFVKVLEKIPKDVGQKKPPAVGHIPLLTKTTSQLNVRPEKNLQKQINIQKNWGDHEKLNLVETCVLRMFLGGKYCYGKTSLARSLLLNAGVMTEEDERTEVLEFNPWKIDDDTTVTLYDLGGHQCYQHLCHLFHYNAPNNFTLLPHQINDTDYSTTCSWIIDVISRSPKSFIHFILTKSDLVPEEQWDQLKEDFKNHITKFLQKEIKALSIKIRSIQKKNPISANNEEFLKQIKEKYESIVEDLKQEQILDVVSCKTGHGLSEFCSKIIDMVRSGVFKIQMQQTAHLLYKQLGKLGVEGVKQRKAVAPKKRQLGKEDLKQKKEVTFKKSPVSYIKQKIGTALSRKQNVDESRDIPKPKDSMKTEDEIPKTSIKKENPKMALNMKFTSQKNMTKDDSLQYDTFDDAKKKLVNNDSLQYVTFEDAKKELIKLLPSKLSDNEVDHQLEQYLQLFHSHGLLLWHNTEKLKKFIFNDLFSFIQMLKTLFQHSFLANNEKNISENQENSFDFDRLSPEQHEFLEDKNISKRKYNQLLQKLKDEGVFSVLLLHVQSMKFNFEGQLHALIHILEHLGIAYLIPSDQDEPDIEKQNLFFPWYLAQSEVPEDIYIAVRKMTKDTNNDFKLKVSVDGMFPSAFFNCLAVGIYKHLVPKFGTSIRMMWPEHIFACIKNQSQVYLEYLKTDNGDRINILVISPFSVPSIRESWKFIGNCLEVINKLTSEWWGGLSMDQYLHCLYCNIVFGKGEPKFEPHFWNIVEHLETVCSEEVMCQCPGKLQILPAALLFPLPQDDRQALQYVSEAAKYLQKHRPNSPSQSFQDTRGSNDNKLSDEVQTNSSKGIDVPTHQTSHTLEREPLDQSHAVEPQPSSQSHKSSVVCDHSTPIQIHRMQHETSSSVPIVPVETAPSVMQSPMQEVMLQNQKVIQQLQVLSDQNKVLSDQVFVQGRALEQQVVAVHHSISNNITEKAHQVTAKVGQAQTQLTCDIKLEAGRAATITVPYKDPFLKYYKNPLEKHLDVTEDLLRQLFSADVINRDEMAVIMDDKEALGKRKRLLLFIDQQERPGIIRSFIEVLEGSKIGTQNYALGCTLRKSLEKGD